MCALQVPQPRRARGIKGDAGMEAGEASMQGFDVPLAPDRRTGRSQVVSCHFDALFDF